MSLSALLLSFKLYVCVVDVDLLLIIQFEMLNFGHLEWAFAAEQVVVSNSDIVWAIAFYEVSTQWCVRYNSILQLINLSLLILSKLNALLSIVGFHSTLQIWRFHALEIANFLLDLLYAVIYFFLALF